MSCRVLCHLKLSCMQNWYVNAHMCTLTHTNISSTYMIGDLTLLSIYIRKSYLYRMINYSTKDPPGKKVLGQANFLWRKTCICFTVVEHTM